MRRRTRGWGDLCRTEEVTAPAAGSRPPPGQVVVGMQYWEGKSPGGRATRREGGRVGGRQRLPCRRCSGWSAIGGQSRFCYWEGSAGDEEEIGKKVSAGIECGSSVEAVRNSRIPTDVELLPSTLGPTEFCRGTVRSIFSRNTMRQCQEEPNTQNRGIRDLSNANV